MQGETPFFWHRGSSFYSMLFKLDVSYSKQAVFDYTVLLSHSASPLPWLWLGWKETWGEGWVPHPFLIPSPAPPQASREPNICACVF